MVPFPPLPCHSHAPWCCQCKNVCMSTAILKAVSQGSPEYNSVTDHRKPKTVSFLSLSAKIGSKQYCLLVFSQVPVLHHLRDHPISSEHVRATELSGACHHKGPVNATSFLAVGTPGVGTFTFSLQAEGNLLAWQIPKRETY